MARLRELSLTRVIVNVSILVDTHIDDFIWLEHIIDKLDAKHSVSTNEVEEIFRNAPRFRRGKRGIRKGEDLYYVLGQTDDGRY